VHAELLDYPNFASFFTVNLTRANNLGTTEGLVLKNKPPGKQRRVTEGTRLSRPCSRNCQRRTITVRHGGNKAVTALLRLSAVGNFSKNSPLETRPSRPCSKNSQRQTITSGNKAVTALFEKFPTTDNHVWEQGRHGLVRKIPNDRQSR
jgi:hypothetical protein